VEVSLDIDFDVLFTEACPIYALIQRLGRVNRRGERPPAEVFVYKQTPNADRVYDPALVRNSVKQLFSRGRSELKELELTEIVNEVYDRDDYESRFQEEFKKTRALIADVQDNLCHIYRLSIDEKMLQQAVTRESDYVTINVVPRDYADKVLSLPKDERYRRVEFTVKVPYYKIKQNLRQPVDGVLIADVDYDPQMGVIYPERDTEAYIY
jgi:CRISPR-associated endonuclease/helicase Cas3